MPPPTTSMRFGAGGSSSAPVESTMRGSSGTSGKLHRLRAGGDDRLREANDLRLRRSSPCPGPSVSSTST